MENTGTNEPKHEAERVFLVRGFDEDETMTTTIISTINRPDDRELKSLQIKALSRQVKDEQPLRGFAEVGITLEFTDA